MACVVFYTSFTSIYRSMSKHLSKKDENQPFDIADFQIVNIQEGNRIFRLTELSRSLYVIIGILKKNFIILL